MLKAILWGASSGMGRALTERLKSEGWEVYAVARDTSKILDSADASYEFDASDPSTIEQASMFIAQEVDQVDLVVYFAGTLDYEKLDRMSIEGWRKTIDSNLTGAYLTAHLSLPLLRKEGHMMFIGAYVDHLILPKMGAYAVAKAGLETLVRMLAKENRKHHFTLIRPGAVDTPFWEQVSLKLPADAKHASEIADKILKQYEVDQDGELDL